MTSSLSARPPHVSCARPSRMARSISRNEPCSAYGLPRIDDEVVGENELGQRMGAVAVRRPVRLAVEAVPEREIGVEPRPVCADVALGEVERVLHVVEVADLEVAVHRIELLRRQHQVLHLRPADPLDPHRELAPRQRLGDHPDELYTVQELRAVDLDDEAEDVLSVHVDRARIGERELAGRDRLQRRRRVHDERIPARAGKHTHAVPDPPCSSSTRKATVSPAGVVQTPSCPRPSPRRDRRRRSRTRTRPRRLRTAQDRPTAAGRERAQPEAVDEPVREQRRGLGERQRVLHEHQMPRPLRARKRVHVRDVRDRLRQRPRSRDVIRHRLPAAGAG